MNDDITQPADWLPIPMSEVTKSHSQGIFRDGLASDPDADALLDVAEGAAAVARGWRDQNNQGPPKAVDELDRRRNIRKQDAAVIVEAARDTVFGDTSMWGFDELCPDYRRIGYYPQEPTGLPSEQPEREAYFEALDWEKERFEAADRVMVSPLIPVIAGYRDRGVARGFDKLAEKWMGGKPEWQDIEMHHDVPMIFDGRPDGRSQIGMVKVAWPVEILDEGGIFMRDVDDVELSDALYDHVAWGAPEHHDPEHSDWGRLMGEKWRGWIRRLLRDDERHDQTAIRSLVEAYMHACRELYEIAAMMDSGIFNGLVPGQRQNIELTVPVAFGKSRYTYGEAPYYIGITQSEYDASRSVSERLDVSVDPVSEALDVVAGDYFDQAIEHVHLMASRQVMPWMMRDIPSTQDVRQLVRGVLVASGAEGYDDDRALAKLAVVRDLLIQMTADDEVWRLLSRVT